MLRADINRHLDVLGQVDRHLKTLNKHLKTVVDKGQDPVIIEHSQRQLNNIEKIHKDIKFMLSPAGTTSFDDSINAKSKLRGRIG